MSQGIHLKYDADGEMAEAVEVLKTMGIPVRPFLRDALKKEASRWKKIADEVNNHTKGTPE